MAATHEPNYAVDNRPAAPAEAALLYYAEQLRPNKKSHCLRTSLEELLVDLMHFCDQRGYVFDDVLEAAEAEFLEHVDPEACPARREPLGRTTTSSGQPEALEG